MDIQYSSLRSGAPDLSAKIAALRGARTTAARRRQDADEDRDVARQRRRKRRLEERELEELLRFRVRIRLPEKAWPRLSSRAARSVYHRFSGLPAGVVGSSDWRGPDGLHSLHFAFTARGFASRSGRRWRKGEAERAALYITRADALEGVAGWWSNIAADRSELAAFYRTLERFERHDRKNANVYISEIIALPAELSARQRRSIVRRIGLSLEAQGLPYTAALHTPDPAGDQRNFHCHIIYSLRPAQRTAPCEWAFALSKNGQINTPAGIRERRRLAVRAINATLFAAGIDKRYTHLSNRSRGIGQAQAKVGQRGTWRNRRIAAAEAKVVKLRRLHEVIGALSAALSHGSEALERVSGRARSIVTELGRKRTQLHALGAAAEASKARLQAMAEAMLQGPALSGQLLDGFFERHNRLARCRDRAERSLGSLAATDALDGAAKSAARLSECEIRGRSLGRLAHQSERLALFDGDIFGRAVQLVPLGYIARHSSMSAVAAVHARVASQGRRFVDVRNHIEARLERSMSMCDLDRRRVALASLEQCAEKRAKLEAQIERARAADAVSQALAADWRRRRAVTQRFLDAMDTAIRARAERYSVALDGMMRVVANRVQSAAKRVADLNRIKALLEASAVHLRSRKIAVPEILSAKAIAISDASSALVRARRSVFALLNERHSMTARTCRASELRLMRAEDAARHRSPAAASELPATVEMPQSADPRRQAIAAYANFLDTHPVKLARTAAGIEVDLTSLPEEWRPYAQAFDAEPETLAVLARLEAAEIRTAAQWARIDAHREHALQLIVHDIENARLRPARVVEGKLTLEPGAVREDLRSRAIAWSDSDVIQQALARADAAWARREQERGAERTMSRPTAEHQPDEATHDVVVSEPNPQPTAQQDRQRDEDDWLVRAWKARGRKGWEK